MTTHSLEQLRQFNKISLGFLPTPVMALPRFSKALDGPAIWIKRDDNTGLAMGGNKVRKLEFLLADAIANQADTIVTAGAAQSNHCRQTAAAAARLGLRCHLLLGGEAPPSKQGNLLLDDLLGAQIHWAGDNRKGEDVDTLMAELHSAGHNPYWVPYGGSNALGTLAFAAALVELNQQLGQKSAISDIVFASSSGATHAGLVLGNELLGCPYRITGINIDKSEHGDGSFRQYIMQLVNQAAELIEFDFECQASQLELDSAYVGDGYGVVAELEREAIRLMAQTEGILVDPVYTGRALGGLIDKVRNQQYADEAAVLFWHTGGAPALFAYQESLG